MAQQQLNNLESAQVFREKLNNNFTDLYTNKAAVNHSSATTDYGVATSSLYGHLKVTTGNGLRNNNGTLSMAAATMNTPGAVQFATTISDGDPNKAVSAATMKSYAEDALVKTFWGTGKPLPDMGKIGDIYVELDEW